MPSHGSASRARPPSSTSKAATTLSSVDAIFLRFPPSLPPRTRRCYDNAAVPHRRRDTGGGLIMVGDGINDAPALAAATVGIVLTQRASATAVAVADVLLLQDSIRGVPFCIAKACQTTALVKQSVALALTCIVFAELPSVLGFLPLWLTVLLHEGGTLLVCLNSIRALNAPTWSLADDIRQPVDGLRNYLSEKNEWLLSSNRVANVVPL